MPRPPVLAALALLALAAVALAAPPARGAPWSWPVRGRVAVPFHVGANPFAAGQHRGIEIAARPGAPVRAACAGRVAFAGRVAAQGAVVAQTCGALTATYLRLGALAVRAGERLAPGRRIGAVGADARLYLGARRTARRFGYLDPVALLPPHAGPPQRPLPAPARRRVPVGVWVRGPGPAPSVRPAPAARPAIAPAPSGDPRAHPARGGALAARLGLLLAGLALPTWGGALVLARGRARRAARVRAPASRAA